LTFHFLDVLAPDVGDMRDIGRGSGDAMTTSDFRHETRRSNPRLPRTAPATKYQRRQCDQFRMAVVLGGWCQMRWASRRRTSGTVSGIRSSMVWGATFSAGLGGGDGEEGVGQHGQGDVSVPAVVAADLVLVQADLAFGALEGLLDRPAGTSDPDQFP